MAEILKVDTTPEADKSGEKEYVGKGKDYELLLKKEGGENSKHVEEAAKKVDQRAKELNSRFKEALEGTLWSELNEDEAKLTARLTNEKLSDLGEKVMGKLQKEGFDLEKYRWNAAYEEALKEGIAEDRAGAEASRSLKASPERYDEQAKELFDKDKADILDAYARDLNGFIKRELPNIIETVDSLDADEVAVAEALGPQKAMEAEEVVAEAEEDETMADRGKEIAKAIEKRKRMLRGY